MKKIALVAALPVALTLAACGEKAEETTPAEEAVVTETVVETPAAEATDAMGMETPAADATDAMGMETPAADATATEAPAGE